MVTPLIFDTNRSNKANSIINQEAQQQWYASFKPQTNRYAYNQNHSDCAQFCRSVNDKTLPEEWQDNAPLERLSHIYRLKEERIECSLNQSDARPPRMCIWTRRGARQRNLSIPRKEPPPPVYTSPPYISAQTRMPCRTSILLSPCIAGTRYREPHVFRLSCSAPRLRIVWCWQRY